MSTLSIQEKTIENYQVQFDKQRVAWVNKNWLYTHYKVGEKENITKVKHNLLLSRVMCTDDCSVINFIHDKLNGKIEESCHKKPLQDKLREYKKNCGYNPSEETVNSCCEISNIISPKW